MDAGLFIVVVITLGFAVSRFLVPVSGTVEKKDIYKDLAHVFVGGLFGAAIYAWSDWSLWFLAIGLTVVELVAFFVRRQPPKQPLGFQGCQGNTGLPGPSGVAAYRPYDGI